MSDTANKLNITPNGGTVYTLQLNPSSLKHTFNIQYSNPCDDKQAAGSLAKKLSFSHYDSETLTFDALFDSTGVTESANAQIKTKIDGLKKSVYKYDGSYHEPQPVNIVWGALDFDGRLTTMSVDYTLFDTSGIPLRAKVSLGFKGYMTLKEQEAVKKANSPDLTHIIEFKSGDTLPLLCRQVYKDSSFYIDVARANNLVNTRLIKPGTKIYFPPLI